MDDLDRIETLLAIMARLRHRETGCPWDLEQDFASIAPYTLEEAYEVADAIARHDLPGLREELGDLLLQVVFHAQMASESGSFTFGDVVSSICSKMIARHPHVFGSADARDADAQTAAWEAHKAAERAAKAAGAPVSALDGVALALPALLRAVKLQKRAAQVGFDWPRTEEVLDKLQEETGELLAEARQGADPDRLTDEFGDILFVLANLARHLKIDPEAALRSTNAKFERRFRSVEARLAAQGRSAAQSSLSEMDALWREVKAEEG